MENSSGEDPTTPASLFPIFPVSSNPTPSPSLPRSQDPQWLCNPSFTFDVSTLPGPSSLPLDTAFPDSDSGEDTAIAPSRPPSYGLVESPSSPEDSDEGRRSRRKERRRRKRKRDREGPDHGGRKSGVKAWAGSIAKPAKDYDFDSHGDRDNLAFGSLYRMDVAHYRVSSHTELSRNSFHLIPLWRRFSSMDAEGDVDSLDNKLRSGGRYFSVKYAALERHKGFKHVKIVDKFPPLIPGEYIPLVELHSSAEKDDAVPVTKVEHWESWEDELIRRTRELNKMSRDSPHDEKVWLAFAEFQDKIAIAQPQKAARMQTLEKKISILEKAVELNPDNEELILCLLKSYQGRDASDALIKRWERVLMQHSDSCKLWKEFLLVLQGDFSRFKVSDMRKAYANAIQALSSACNRLCRQGYQTSKFQLTDPSLIQLELGLVDIFISLCRFEWQTGHQELATGLFQAELEYSLFCPSLLLSSQSKRRLFEHFWNSGGARIGEEGALGWSAWLGEEERNRHNMYAEEISQENELGGWTGWSHPPSNENGEPEELAKSAEHAVGGEETLDSEDTQMKDDVESLLRKLGINVDAEPHGEVKDAQTWNRWSQEETMRDSEQWMPLHECSGIDGNMLSTPTGDNLDEEGNTELSRIILFEDVNEYLFSLCSDEARFSLVARFIDFYGGKISLWACTNNSSWIENTLSMEEVPDSLLEDLKKIFELVNGPNRCSSHYKLEALFGVILAAEELIMTQFHSLTCTVNPSRILAKKLLKNDRQDVVLCGVYARTEATCGNIEVARNIFDAALTVANGLPVDLQENVPLIYFWYAEMEMSMSALNRSSEPSKQRAVHILSCLGSNVKYTPFTSQTPGLQILRARQGFKEKTRNLRSSWVHGCIKEYSIAYICSASLFETLTSGWSAGVEVMEEAFTMALPERRSQSFLLETLWIHYIGVLQRQLKQLKFSRVWHIMKQGMQIYPFNPKIFTAMAEVGHLSTVPNKIRLLFDECSQRHPSVIASLFALSYELGRDGFKHRIRRLFERALENGKLEKSVLLWRSYLAYEVNITRDTSAARRVFFRAIHTCPWSKKLWLDGFQKLSSILTTQELSDLQEIMREKELHMRTDIYEILLQEETET